MQTKYKNVFYVPCNHNIVDTNDTKIVTIRNKCFIVYPLYTSNTKKKTQNNKQKKTVKKNEKKQHRLMI